MAAEILIVDDEADIRDLVAGILEDEGYVARTARNSDDALAVDRRRRPHLIFLDIWLQGSQARRPATARHPQAEHPELPVVMISGHGNIETAVAAIKHGAYDFIEKPFKADRLVLVADRALETSRLKREVKQLKQLAPLPSTLVGKSAVMISAAPGHRQGRADQQPRADRRPVRRRQGTGGAHDASVCRRAPTGRSSSSTPPP